MDLKADLATRGFAIVRGLFRRDEIEAIGNEVDRIHAIGIGHGRSFRHGNLFFNIAPDTRTGAPLVRMAQWPAWISPPLEAMRRDPRWLALLEPLIGQDIKQIIHQLHWKSPETAADFAWHQDSRSRRPADAYRNLASSYIQTGLAIDPHDATSGGLRFIPASHRLGDLQMRVDGGVLGHAATDAALQAAGLDPRSAVQLTLAPGDVAIWSPYLVHASGINHARHQRRFLINGYVRAADCDRGEWAFCAGKPVPLGNKPALVHFEDLHRRPEPHYP